MTCPEDFEATLSSIKVEELFSRKLEIPEYQREYSWSPQQAMDLLEDISAHHDRDYLLGTVILHKKDRATYHVVDGQQRLITLTILDWALNKSKESPLASKPGIKSLLAGKFSAGAQVRIGKVKSTIERFLARPDGKRLSGAFEHLRFHVIELSGENALDRAYTFFDSVNSKGKPLTDFDLLKAHHLMHIPIEQSVLARKRNDEWQGYGEEAQQKVFGATLRRLRMWAQGNDRDPRRIRPDYNEFSPVVEPHQGETPEHLFNRYMQPVAFRSWRSENDRLVLHMDYPVPAAEDIMPVEVPQTIEGGDSFFLYARRYHALYQKLFINEKTIPRSPSLDFLHGLANSLDNLYLQEAFMAVMLLYVDKFDEDRLPSVAVCVERIISEWRYKSERVYLLGTLSHVKSHDLVPTILNSAYSRHVLEQFLVKAQTLTGRPEGGKIPEIKQRYHNKVYGFYKCHPTAIKDARVKAITPQLIEF